MRFNWNIQRVLAIMLLSFVFSAFYLVEESLCAEIRNLEISKQAANTGDYENDDKQFKSNVAILGNSDCYFHTRYSQVHAIDRGAMGSTVAYSAVSDYRVTFTIEANGPPNPEFWILEINTRRKGELNIVDDGGSHGHVYLHSVDGYFSGGGVESTGSLDLPGSYHATNEDDHSSDAYVAVDESSSQMIYGYGPQTITLYFSWTTQVTSSSSGLAGGDEAALRFGEACSLSNVTAGDYPGPHNRVQSGDGHFVSATLSMLDNIEVVIPQRPTQCSEVPPGSCTFYASGSVLGCPGANYTVFLNYLNRDGDTICSTSIPVINGNLNWYSEITCDCECDAVEVEYWAVNDDGKNIDAKTAVKRMPVEDIPNCMPVSIPTASSWGLILLCIILMASGVLLIRKRVVN